jgi:hypothetical protein
MIVMEDKKQPSQAVPPATGAAPAQAADAPSPATQTAKLVFRQPKVGDSIWLHVPPRISRPHQPPLPATILRVVKGMTVNLKTTDESPDQFEVSRSVFDPTGKKPDGWSFRD